MSKSSSLGRVNGGLTSSGVSSGFVSPTLMAASLRSVLAHMDQEELARYKAAFHSYDADEDGYLNLGQALEALQACGVQVSSGAILDTLDDIEVAQEDGLDATPWEMEQNRRRRRRRRNSLEQIESAETVPMAHGGHGTGKPAHKEDPSVEEAREADRIARLADRDGPPSLTRSLSLEDVPSNSSLKSPTIDISTFLNLARAPAPTPTMPSRSVSQIGVGMATGTAPTTAAYTGSSRVPPRPVPVGHSTPDWDRSASYSTSRTYTNVATGATTAPAATARPVLRLRDHQQSLQSLHTHLAPTVSRRNLGVGGGAGGGAGDDLDDDFDFDPELDLLAAFHTFDPSKSGVMSTKNLIAIMMNMGEKWSEDDATEMAEEIDQKREGRFHYGNLVKQLAARE